ASFEVGKWSAGLNDVSWLHSWLKGMLTVSVYVTGWCRPSAPTTSVSSVFASASIRSQNRPATAASSNVFSGDARPTRICQGLDFIFARSYPKESYIAFFFFSIACAARVGRNSAKPSDIEAQVSGLL